MSNIGFIVFNVYDIRTEPKKVAEILVSQITELLDHYSIHAGCVRMELKSGSGDFIEPFDRVIQGDRVIIPQAEWIGESPAPPSRGTVTVSYVDTKPEDEFNLGGKAT